MPTPQHVTKIEAEWNENLPGTRTLPGTGLGMRELTMTAALEKNLMILTQVPAKAPSTLTLATGLAEGLGDTYSAEIMPSAINRDSNSIAGALPRSQAPEHRHGHVVLAPVGQTIGTPGSPRRW